MQPSSFFSPSRVVRVSVLGASVFLAALFLGCGSAGGGGGGEEKAPESFRIIHAAAEISTLHVAVGEDPTEIDVDYGDATSYFEVPEGAVPIRVRTDDDVLPSIAADLTISAGSSTTYVVTETNGALEGTLLTDNNADPKPTLFKVRFINAAISDSTIDFFINLPDDRLDDADSIAAAVQYKASSTYSSVDEGSYQFKATITGSDRVLVESDNLDISAGEIVSVVLIQDEDGGRPYRLLVLRD